MKVYRYGLLAPTEQRDRVFQSMRIAHDYRNALCELDRERRRRLRLLDTAATEALRTRVEECRRSLDASVAEQRRERARTRKRSTPTAIRDAIRAARSELKEATAAWRQARDAARTASAGKRDAINEWWLAERRRLRPGRSQRPDGIDAGTYQLVEDAASRSSSDLPLWDRDQPQDPRFLRWTGEGAVSVQIVGGVGVAAMLDGKSTQVAVTEPSDAAADRRDPSSRRSQTRKRMLLWLRVGSNEDRSPVWAQWPMVMHRPLPPQGTIKRATVILRKIGPREEWCVQFVVDEPAVPVTCGRGLVGVDVGWRLRRDGTIRVAVACDEHGRLEEVTVPPLVVGGLLKADDLRSIRDKNFDAAKAELARWLRERDVTITREPSHWLGRCDQIMQWRSPARLASVVVQWRNQRIDGDEDIYERMEAWRRQDKHLWLWETSERTSSLRSRKDHYRCVAARWARTYGAAILEKFDLRQIARRQDERDEAENETARSHRFMAAVSEFRDCLRNAFRSRGGEVHEVAAEHTTSTCSECGELVDFDRSMLRAKCSQGHEWDQDENAARNILERFRGAPPPVAARTADEPQGSRWDRARRLRTEKVARMDLSRKEAQ